MCRQSISLVAAEFGRTDTAGFAVEPTETNHRADTHAELLRSFRDRGAILLRHHHPRPQILRKRLPHPILASVPVRILNPIRVRSGTPHDSVFSANALVIRTDPSPSWSGPKVRDSSRHPFGEITG